MIHFPIENSACVEWLRHDGAETLTVKYKNSGMWAYNYFPVTPQVAEQIATAPSVGRAVTNLKKLMRIGGLSYHCVIAQ